MAIQHQVIVVLKGHHSFIAMPGGRAWFNSSGNASMAKGGSGDVLTGMITGLLARGYAPEQAALLGVYLHGLAGEIASRKLGMESVLATDIIDAIGTAFLELESTN
jgi:NAD(P)H-hydrate epimerase